MLRWLLQPCTKVLCFQNPMDPQNAQNFFPIGVFLNSLGQDDSNGTPFEAVGSILTSNHPLPYSKISKNYENFSKKKKMQKNPFEVIKFLAAYLKCPKTLYLIDQPSLVYMVPIVQQSYSVYRLAANGWTLGYLLQW